jgi:hypothetical protein
MKLKTVLLIGLIVAVLATAYVWFFIYNKPKKDILESKADYVLTVAQLVQEFETNHDSAISKYNDKVLEINGEVSRIEPNDSISSVVLKSGDKYEVFCEVHPEYNAQAKQLASPQKIVLKGLFISAEKPDTDFDLTGLVRLKKSSFTKEGN